MTQQKTIHPSELVSQLADRMRARNLRWEKSTPWTSALKNSLRDLLESKGTKITDVLYSDRETDNHEFLLDVVVWDRSSGEGVTLAVECEWTQNISAIEEDFWKLLVVKAPIKLMIFACNNNPTRFTQDAVREKLSKCLLLYRDHAEGERYIFMDYAPPPGRKAWWIEIPASGKLQTLPEPNWIIFD